jgi:hypothetical protein
MGCKQSKSTTDYVEQPERSIVESTLNVIVVHYNPQRFKRRAALINECLQRLSDTRKRLQSSSEFRLNVVAVELIYENENDNPDVQFDSQDGIEMTHSIPNKSEIMKTVDHDVQIIRRTVESKQVMWSKEQLINIAIRSLPEDEKYVAWIDSDVSFTDDSWVSKAIMSLSKQPLAFGQLWSTCDMLGPDGEAQKGMTMTSFAQQKALGKTYVSCSNRQVDEYWHPGFAWVATMAALKKTGCLIDKTLGSADRHMAMAFLGRASETVPDNIHINYKSQVIEWQQRVVRHKIKLIVVPVHIKHHWHGSLRRRRYMERWDILARHRFDPDRHLTFNRKTDLYTWDHSCPEELLDAVNEYFESRQEDSLDDEDDYPDDSRNVYEGYDDYDEAMVEGAPSSIAESIMQGANAIANAISEAIGESSTSPIENNNHTADLTSLDFYA